MIRRIAVLLLAAGLLAVVACPFALGASPPPIKYDLRATTGSSPALHVKVSFNLQGGKNALLKPSEQSMLNGTGKNTPTLNLDSNPSSGTVIQPLPNGKPGWSIESSGASSVTVAYRVEPAAAGSSQSSQETAWTQEPAPFVITDALKLFRASDALLLPTTESGASLGSDYQVTIEKGGKETAVTPWLSSNGAYTVSGRTGLLDNYLSWGTLVLQEYKNGASTVRLAFPSTSTEQLRSESKTAAGSILSEARLILGDRPSMPILSMLAVAPASASPPSMIDSVTLPDSKLDGDKGVRASGSVYDLWNRWSLVPARDKDALWFQDGSSVLYSFRLAVLAGLIPKDAANTEFSATYTAYINNPLAKTMSLAEAETSSDPNAAALLEDKGAIVCAAVGQRLRDESKGNKDLDWFMGEMAKKFPALENKKYSLVDIEEMLEGATTKSWARFFDDYVRGTKLINPATFTASDIVGIGTQSTGKRLVLKGSGRSWIYLLIGMIIIMMVPVIFGGYVRRSVKLDMQMPNLFGDGTDSDTEGVSPLLGGDYEKDYKDVTGASQLPGGDEDKDVAGIAQLLSGGEDHSDEDTESISQLLSGDEDRKDEDTERIARLLSADDEKEDRGDSDTPL